MSSPPQTPNPVDEAVAETFIKEWDEAHKRLANEPKKDGRAYLTHAVNILPLFENIAELNPAAKAVVYSFRVVINFEYERLENDLRVTSVLLAQVSMMRVIYGIATIIKRNDGIFIQRSNESLEALLYRIRRDIEEFGNAADTYYKEKKIVKFFKAQEWKQRMLGYSKSFADYSIVLQNELSIRNTRDVGEIHRKMDGLTSIQGDLSTKIDILVVSAFSSQRDWEKKTRSVLREYGPVENWIDDPEKVKNLVLSTEDPTVDAKLFTASAHDHNKEITEADEARLQAFMMELKQELMQPLEVLVTNNMNLFMQRLEFNTRELQNTIAKSAKSIVRQLGGPYHRVEHEDLKRLWKEMGWIFCVERKLFTTALYEFYQDYFQSEYSSPPVDSEEDGILLTKDELTRKQEDMWTLDYLDRYGDRINDTVDKDNSRFIRISEVNAFTSSIPEGWTLPQWCAYIAVGWQYELRIYQKRVQHLIDRILDTQAEVAPENRWGLSFLSQWLYPMVLLSRGPHTIDFSSLPAIFRRQIQNKVLDQDTRMRADWKEFDYRMDDQPTISLLYQHQETDTYMLQLCLIFLEHCLDVIESAKTETRYIRDWIALDKKIIVIEQLVKARITGLEKLYEARSVTFTDAIKTHFAGLYQFYYASFYLNDDPNWTPQEIESLLADTFIIEEFPSPPPPTTSVVISTSTGEDTSGPIISFPYHRSVTCDMCESSPIIGSCYCCSDCEDFDLCAKCYKESVQNFDKTKLGNHLETHDMAKMSIYYPYYSRSFMKCLSRHHRENYINMYAHVGADVDDDSGDSDDDEEQDGEEKDGDKKEEKKKEEKPKSPTHTCGECKEIITSERFFKCLYPTCKDHYICWDCNYKVDKGHQDAVDPSETQDSEESTESGEVTAAAEEGAAEGDATVETQEAPDAAKDEAFADEADATLVPGLSVEPDSKEEEPDAANAETISTPTKEEPSEGDAAWTVVDAAKQEDEVSGSELSESVEGGPEANGQEVQEPPAGATTAEPTGVAEDGDEGKSSEQYKDDDGNSDDFPVAESNKHEWWHTLLTLRKLDPQNPWTVSSSKDADTEAGAETATAPTTAEGTGLVAGGESTDQAGGVAVQSHLTAVDTRLSAIESRQTKIEENLEKVNAGVGELMSLVKALMEKLQAAP